MSDRAIHILKNFRTDRADQCPPNFVAASNRVRILISVSMARNAMGAVFLDRQVRRMEILGGTKQ